MRTLAVVLLLALSVVQTACATPSWVELGSRRFQVEVADTPSARARGLMFRESMAPDHGMLFTYPDAGARVFWMKNTLIPLDILFFDADGRLVNWHTAQPCRADPCATYPSTAPARYILELNAGAAKSLGLQRGDPLRMHIPER